MSDVVKVLTKAMKLIEKGWGRDCFHKTIAGRDCYCTMGAINAASGRDPSDISTGMCPGQEEPVIQAFCDTIGVKWTGDVFAWNDKKHSKRPVITAFKRAIEKAKAQS